MTLRLRAGARGPRAFDVSGSEPPGFTTLVFKTAVVAAHLRLKSSCGFKQPEYVNGSGADFFGIGDYFGSRFFMLLFMLLFRVCQRGAKAGLAGYDIGCNHEVFLELHALR